MGLPETGFVRLKSIILPDGPIPVRKSKWWMGVKSGEFPQPRKIGGATVWSVEEIRELVKSLEGSSHIPSHKKSWMVVDKGGR